ncbi:MAG: hypothetical protein H6625_02020 [Bdellovibrionaceae bacterium]|nr:hypothetical protein [Pseudobdellovibrionaceae bacterium]
MKKLFLLMFVFILPMISFAQNVDFSIHENYISTRAKGMGGAFTAVADDYNSMFYNPAALARLEEGNLHMFIRGAIDTNYLDLIDDLDKAEKETDKETAIGNVITSNYGKNYYSRLPTIGAMWVRPNWGIAIIPADLTIDLSLHQGLGPAIGLNAYLDTTLAYSYARNVKWGQKGKLSVGATLKVINRVQASESVGIPQLSSGGEVFDQDSANEGLFADLDLGFLYTPEIGSDSFFSFLKYSKPTFALVTRNLIDSGPVTNLNLIDKKSKDAYNLQRRIDIGSKWQLPKFWVFDPRFAWDIRNMMHENWSFEKGNHVGFELGWKMYSWWRGYWSAGLNQWAFDFGDLDNWTFGFGAEIAWFQIDLSTWQENVGTDSIDIRGRRYMVELSLDF